MAEVVLTAENFKQEVLGSDIPVLVDFWATWCGPCQMLGPVISEIAEECQGKIKVGKVNVDEARDLAIEYDIESIPTVFFFKEGKVADSFVGYRDKSEIMTIINSL
ncbi:MAG: thioredoxin [Eubacterium sp.]|nr:thioredoxin [Eubacterium sp.]